LRNLPKLAQGGGMEICLKIYNENGDIFTEKKIYYVCKKVYTVLRKIKKTEKIGF